VTSFLAQFDTTKDVPTPATAPPPAWGPTPYAATALAREADAIQRAPEGARNDTLNRAAFNIGQLVAGGQVHHDTARVALIDAAMAAGLSAREIDRTIDSGFREGQKHPRYPTPVGVSGHRGGDQDSEEPTEQELPRALDWHELWDRDDATEWILEPLIAPGRLTALYSVPKTGKSLLTLEMAVAISRGHNALGAPTRKTKVLYVDFENDPTADIRARLIDMGYSPSDLADLVYMSYPHIPPLDTYAGGQYLQRIVTHHQAGLVIIDTISRCVTGEENDNNTWLNLYKHTGLLMKRSNTAMLRLDHSGKDEARGQRGGSAKMGDVDMVWRMSEVVKGSSYRLDCEAQRMHVTESSLVLLRSQTPLGHNVTTARATEIKEDVVLRALDAAGLPQDAGRDQAARVLKEAGIPVRTSTLAGILKRRKKGIAAWLEQ
jgi:hypothetical protein